MQWGEWNKKYWPMIWLKPTGSWSKGIFQQGHLSLRGKSSDNFKTRVWRNLVQVKQRLRHHWTWKKKTIINQSDWQIQKIFSLVLIISWISEKDENNDEWWSTPVSSFPSLGSGEDCDGLSGDGGGQAIFVSTHLQPFIVHCF